MLCMVFLFSHIPFESKLSTVSVKTKTPLGVVAFCLIVEIKGVEPLSCDCESHTLTN